MSNHIKAFIDSEIEALENKHKAAEFILKGGQASEAERKFNFKLNINGLNLLCKKSNPDMYENLHKSDDNFSSKYEGKSYYNKSSLNQLQEHKHLFLGDDTGASEPEETKGDRWLWDGKEELKVGMWVFSDSYWDYCEIKMLTEKEFVYIDDQGEIMSDIIDCALPIEKPDDKEGIANAAYNKIISNDDNKSRIKDVLRNLYDKAIKHK